ncbi:MAG: 1-deoxy-D-xylulose-5-phosphate reductoisomerase [Ignavibacteriae bacterium]|nr:1-deoxy-D-xylulose-5-phosphate reductoisomerase [Ignavibacteriota bacterium]MCB9207036.1 1-deoxy-D-xylulose-5-phosphate reductoisomerase [Ignavibacteriales bacterium]MCB9207785.1 1-deoxy-D-xylulose-5-phosphate reductoisomerase [Ignavibacteriales bacterium]MCB9258555.1 1-deoxy-D-xylulose-5-phosphate reductoisomerase [Ignavibacteriales bacterium]
MKKILLLGSTGSIGVNTLEVIRKFNDIFEVFALTANSNITLLEKQVKEFNPKFVVVKDKNKAKELKNLLNGKCIVLSGSEGLIEITKNGDYDILVSALVGFAGLAPTIESIKRGKRIALANKETLVAAGEIVIELAHKYNSEILPVDSEHSAIFQCLVGEENKTIEKLIITASGGPFLRKSFEDLKFVKVEDALKHPNWDMGNKITIDSATMMNKGLEVIEAHWLFNLGKDKIDVVVHPQSIVHSMVEFIDGSIKAQLSMPDMKLPIQYALTYPKRLESAFVDTHFPTLKELTFFEPDFNKFQCLKLAFDAMTEGGTAPCILNAANEIAVDKFLNKEIKFLQIPELIKKSLESIEILNKIDFDTILECDLKTRELTLTLDT